MATVNLNNHIKPNDLKKSTPIQFFCPICNSHAKLEVSNSIINQTNHLAIISIPKNKICEHRFQAFVDKHFTVRGYQKIDYEFENDFIEEPRNSSIDFKKFMKDSKNLLENLIMKGNHLEYRPKDSGYDGKKKKKKNFNNKKKEMTLQKIYEEFWEFIDENNEEFREFILNDAKRSRL